MQRGEGHRVKCPRCGWFVVRVSSPEAELEINCAHGSCSTTLFVRLKDNLVTVNVTEKLKQA